MTISAGLERMRGDPSRVLLGMGHVEARRGTVWIDSPEPRDLEWRLDGGTVQSGQFAAPAGPVAVPLVEAWGCQLQPNTRYQLTIGESEPLIFHTDFAEDTPDARYALAIGSCHQPFNEDGSLNPPQLTTLRVFASSADALGVRRILLLGDQMYADQPTSLSLYRRDVVAALTDGHVKEAADVSAEQLDAWFTQRYRSYWNVPGWRAMMAVAPTYMVWDDHEVWDNYGSGRKDRTEARRPLVDAARRAYHRYQRLGRSEPSTGSDFAFRYGRVATIVVDIRDHRGYYDGVYRVFSSDQREWLPTQLEAMSDAAVLLIGLSVPCLPLPGFAIDLAGGILPDGNNIQDRWSYGDGRKERQWLLETLNAHADRYPHQKIIIVSGDIHMGYASEFVRADGRASICQFVSSAVTNQESKVVQTLVAGGLRCLSNSPAPGVFTRSRRLIGVSGHQQNPFTGQNLGIIEVEHRGEETSVRLSLMTADPSGALQFPFRSNEF